MGNTQSNPVSGPTGRYSGAQDIIVVEKEGGKILESTPWVFHKNRCPLWTEETLVKIRINGRTFDNIKISSKNCEEVASRTFSYTPTADDLRQIIDVLKPGGNSILFFSNESMVPARIYLLSPKSKLIVTDIDKTLTKSVLMGLLALCEDHPQLHEGTAALFSILEEKGYTIVYLTARPISSSVATRCLISDHALNADGAKLPDGPLFCSNAGLCETIMKGHWLHHDEVKIPILKAVKPLFVEGSLYAGFGDTASDRKSYNQMGIPYNRIFEIFTGGSVQIIDSEGNVNVDLPVTAGSVQIFDSMGNVSGGLTVTALAGVLNRFENVHTNFDADSKCLGCFKSLLRKWGLKSFTTQDGPVQIFDSEGNLSGVLTATALTNILNSFENVNTSTDFDADSKPVKCLKVFMSWCKEKCSCSKQ